MDWIIFIAILAAVCGLLPVVIVACERTENTPKTETGIENVDRVFREYVSEVKFRLSRGYETVQINKEISPWFNNDEWKECLLAKFIKHYPSYDVKLEYGNQLRFTRKPTNKLRLTDIMYVDPK